MHRKACFWGGGGGPAPGRCWTRGQKEPRSQGSLLVTRRSDESLSHRELAAEHGVLLSTGSPRPVTEGLLGVDPWRSELRPGGRRLGGRASGEGKSRPGSCREEGEVPHPGSTENQEQDLNSGQRLLQTYVKAGTHKKNEAPDSLKGQKAESTALKKSKDSGSPTGPAPAELQGPWGRGKPQGCSFRRREPGGCTASACCLATTSHVCRGFPMPRQEHTVIWGPCLRTAPQQLSVAFRQSPLLAASGGDGARGPRPRCPPFSRRQSAWM